MNGSSYHYDANASIQDIEKFKKDFGNIINLFSRAYIFLLCTVPFLIYFHELMYHDSPPTIYWLQHDALDLRSKQTFPKLQTKPTHSSDSRLSNSNLIQMHNHYQHNKTTKKYVQWVDSNIKKSNRWSRGSHCLEGIFYENLNMTTFQLQDHSSFISAVTLSHDRTHTNLQLIDYSLIACDSSFPQSIHHLFKDVHIKNGHSYLTSSSSKTITSNIIYPRMFICRYYNHHAKYLMSVKSHPLIENVYLRCPIPLSLRNRMNLMIKLEWSTKTITSPNNYPNQKPMQQMSSKNNIDTNKTNSKLTQKVIHSVQDKKSFNNVNKRILKNKKSSSFISVKSSTSTTKHDIITIQKHLSNLFPICSYSYNLQQDKFDNSQYLFSNLSPSLEINNTHFEFITTRDLFNSQSVNKNSSSQNRTSHISLSKISSPQTTQTTIQKQRHNVKTTDSASLHSQYNLSICTTLGIFEHIYNINILSSSSSSSSAMTSINSNKWKYLYFQPNKVKLIEWIEYHRLLGVQHFFIYEYFVKIAKFENKPFVSNNKKIHEKTKRLLSKKQMKNESNINDNHELMLHRILNEYIRIGLVTIIPFQYPICYDSVTSRNNINISSYKNISSDRTGCRVHNQQYSTTDSDSESESKKANTVNLIYTSSLQNCYLRFSGSSKWIALLHTNQFIAINTHKSIDAKYKNKTEDIKQNKSPKSSPTNLSQDKTMKMKTIYDLIKYSKNRHPGVNAISLYTLKQKINESQYKDDSIELISQLQLPKLVYSSSSSSTSTNLLKRTQTGMYYTSNNNSSNIEDSTVSDLDFKENKITKKNNELTIVKHLNKQGKTKGLERTKMRLESIATRKLNIDIKDITNHVRHKPKHLRIDLLTTFNSIVLIKTSSVVFFVPSQLVSHHLKQHESSHKKRHTHKNEINLSQTSNITSSNSTPTSYILESKQLNRKLRSLKNKKKTQIHSNLDHTSSKKIQSLSGQKRIYAHIHTDNNTNTLFHSHNNKGKHRHQKPFTSSTSVYIQEDPVNELLDERFQLTDIDQANFYTHHSPLVHIHVVTDLTDTTTHSNCHSNSNCHSQSNGNKNSVDDTFNSVVRLDNAIAFLIQIDHYCDEPITTQDDATNTDMKREKSVQTPSNRKNVNVDVDDSHTPPIDSFSFIRNSKPKYDLTIPLFSHYLPPKLLEILKENVLLSLRGFIPLMDDL